MCVVLFATENKTTPARIGRQVIVIAIVPRSFYFFSFLEGCFSDVVDAGRRHLLHRV